MFVCMCVHGRWGHAASPLILGNDVRNMSAEVRVETVPVLSFFILIAPYAVLLSADMTSLFLFVLCIVCTLV